MMRTRHYGPHSRAESVETSVERTSQGNALALTEATAMSREPGRERKVVALAGPSLRT
jgi:hypothetical protein